MNFKTNIEKIDTEEIVNSKYINWDFFKKSTILVTGATGLIGEQIVKSILLANEEKNTSIKILALARNKKKIIDKFKNYKTNNLEYIIQDITKPIRTRKKIDYIIHTANGTSSREFIEKPVETIDSIIEGTKNVLNFAKEKRTKSIVYLSSMEVFGKTNFDRVEPLKENEYGYIDLYNTRSSYPEGKRLAETMCHSYAKEYNLPVKVARLVQTIGAGVDINDNRVFVQFARNIIEEKNIILKTNGSTIRSYCYITDAISGIFAILERGNNGECYNLENSETTCSIKEMAEMLCEQYPKSKLEFQIDEQNKDGYLPTLKTVLDTSKLHNLNWSANITLKKMYERLIENLKTKINKNIKISLVGLLNDNIGDRIILKSTEYLINKVISNVSINKVNLFPPNNIMENHKISPKKNFILQIFSFIRWLYHSKNRDISSYYNNISDSDIIIFAGGGLVKHTRENFWNAIYTIVTICNKKKIPIYFNAIGIEGYDPRNFYSMLLKYTINKNCITHFSTRDDYQNLKRYIKNKNKISLVGDPALYISEIYPKEFKNNNIIGIGLLRGKIFTDYNINFSEKNIIKTYVALIKELEHKGYKWKLFCNGLDADYKMGLNILQQLNLPNTEEYIISKPQNIEEFINTINSFNAIIAGRLHAIITAVSYNIPAVGLIWNDKLKLFGNIIDCPNRFIEKENFFNSKFIIEQLEKAIKEGYNTAKINLLKDKTYNNLKFFIDNETNKII